MEIIVNYPKIVYKLILSSVPLQLGSLAGQTLLGEEEVAFVRIKHPRQGFAMMLEKATRSDALGDGI